MKTKKQVHEIIEYVRSFHKQMGDYYERLHKKNEKQRVKMLLDYLSQHEKHRDETLAEYEKEVSDNIIDSWFRYIPKKITTNECFENIEIQSDMSVNDVIRIALDFDNCLIQIYKELINETELNELRDVFNSLLKRLEQEQRNLVRDALWLYDI